MKTKNNHEEERDTYTLFTPLVFNSFDEANSFINNEWKSGILHECIKGYPPDEVNWDIEYDPENKEYWIILSFQHQIPAMLYGTRITEIKNIERKETN